MLLRSTSAESTASIILIAEFQTIGVEVHPLGARRESKTDLSDVPNLSHNRTCDRIHDYACISKISTYICRMYPNRLQIFDCSFMFMAKARVRVGVRIIVLNIGKRRKEAPICE